MSKNTFNAFIARGIDSHLANSLVEKKMTLTKLKHKSLSELTSLGIDEEIANNILKEQRPPIPFDILTKLLYEAKWTCCICRDNTRSIILHHINEWHKSRDHSEENLVVLCLEHHNDAHTKKGLSVSLSKEQIINAKERWTNEVSKKDALTILGLSNNDYGRWDYFNHNRVFELFLDKRLSNRNYRTTSTVSQLGLINELGTFAIEDKRQSQIYNFDNGYLLYYYMKELFDDVLRTIPLIDITNKLNRNDIKALIKPGVFIAFQGGFYFKSSKNYLGKNQRRLAYYKKGGIKLEFEFDAYETTCNSAWGSHLKRKRVITPICFVKSVIENDNELTIGLSCLAIGSWFLQHDYRKEDNNLQLVSAKFSPYYFEEDLEDETEN